MVTTERDSFVSMLSITVKDMDSLKVEVPDNYFTHSILNFSIFTMADPLQCLWEMRRTLRGDGGGVAAVLTWRRFGTSEDGVLQSLVGEAGFKDVKVLKKSVVVTEQDLDGLTQFFLGD
ncbi:hypothetical protein B0H67DRAFT_650426 [Lasiosphaeris hirsuta]|uniref:Methyltransferase type 11 domain-containing protein n=1 Tax=Lasiosphaeris hirsuta TaxID=260670 RepID=A0AA39ZRZ4_9PEZI|nr:hypothetical protein B0H67DRAFT_650426 [Lasiosphaeris hirsuta]